MRTLDLPLPPPDADLPELGLLDAGLLCAALADTWGTTVEEARVDYLELVPGSSLVLQVTADVHDHRSTVVVRAGSAVTARASATGTPIRGIPSQGMQAVVHRFPCDPELPLLTVPAAELRALLPGPVSADRPTLLSYVPGRRAALGLAPYVVKTYGSPGTYLTAQAALDLLGDGAALPTPAPTATLPDRLTTVQDLVEGTPARLGDAVALADPAGRLLRRLHSSDRVASETRDTTAQLLAAARAVEVLGAVLPDHRSRGVAVLARLAATAPGDLPLVLSHGDFTVDQLLVHDRGLVVTDVDTVCMAPAALDVASFAANVMSGRPGDAEHAERVLAALVAAHGLPPALCWHFALALLRRCDRPFRRLKKRWPEKSIAILAMAEKVSTSCG